MLSVITVAYEDVHQNKPPVFRHSYSSSVWSTPADHRTYFLACTVIRLIVPLYSEDQSEIYYFNDILSFFNNDNQDNKIFFFILRQ